MGREVGRPRPPLDVAARGIEGSGDLADAATDQVVRGLRGGADRDVRVALRQREEFVGDG